jgi:hypothetical protein
MSSKFVLRATLVMLAIGLPFLLWGFAVLLIYRTVLRSILLMYWMLQQGFYQEKYKRL